MVHLPPYLAFGARASNLVNKMATVLFNWIYLVTQTGRLGYAHVSTKRAKSVFKDARNYYYVYRHEDSAAWSNSENPSSLKPLAAIKRRILIYPAGRAATPSDIETDQVFSLIDVYVNSGRKTATVLGELLNDCFQQKMPWQDVFKRIILENFSASEELQVGLCHCDLTRRNIVFHARQAQIIDWDDSCDYIPEYDKIYYCFMAMMEQLGRVGYADGFQSLGLESRDFNADQALSQLDLACQGRFSDLNYFLFLMMFVTKACEISPVASHLWSRLESVVYKGKKHVR